VEAEIGGLPGANPLGSPGIREPSEAAGAGRALGRARETGRFRVLRSHALRLVGMLRGP